MSEATETKLQILRNPAFYSLGDEITRSVFSSVRYKNIKISQDLLYTIMTHPQFIKESFSKEIKSVLDKAAFTGNSVFLQKLLDDPFYRKEILENGQSFLVMLLLSSQDFSSQELIDLMDFMKTFGFSFSNELLDRLFIEAFRSKQVAIMKYIASQDRFGFSDEFRYISLLDKAIEMKQIDALEFLITDTKMSPLLETLRPAVLIDLHEKLLGPSEHLYRFLLDKFPHILERLPNDGFHICPIM